MEVWSKKSCNQNCRRALAATTMKQNGFTLIELMVAVSIIGVVLLAVTQMLVQSLVGAAKAEAITRVKSNGDTALIALERTIRKGVGIDSCNNNQVTFTVSDSNQLARIEINGTELRIRESGTWRTITGSEVVVSQVNDGGTLKPIFVCIDEPDGRRDKVSVEFTLSFNGGVRASRAVDTNFYTSVMMRNKVGN